MLTTLLLLCDDNIDNFHEYINRGNTDMKFNQEDQRKWKYSFFLDFLVIHVDNRLWMTIHTKPTHAHILKDQSSYHPIPTRPQQIGLWWDEHKYSLQLTWQLRVQD